MASLHLVNQATLEMFVSVLLDENQNCTANDKRVFEYESASDPPEKKCENLDFFNCW